MKKLIMIISFVSLIFAETNATKETNTTKVKQSVDKNSSKTLTKEEILKEQLKKQMEREEKYAKEQKFYQGKEYNLKDKEVDAKTLKDVPAIEPDYDFDITDVYRDDQ